MREGNMRMTTDAERALALAMFAALRPIMHGRDLDEVLRALFALLLDTMEQCPDPRAAAEDFIESMRANFPPWLNSNPASACRRTGSRRRRSSPRSGSSSTSTRARPVHQPWDGLVFMNPPFGG